MVTVKVASTAPTGITVTNDNTCAGTNKTLTVTGGSLGTGASWEWYTDAGFTLPAGSGVTITVDPATTTTYYVRAEGDCNTTTGVSAVVTVKVASTAPTGITVTNDNTCAGTNKTLTVTGGSLGTGASWEWYTDAGFTLPAGSGVTITVDPDTITTYYVRAEGECNITLPVSALITVLQVSIGPDSILVSSDSTCAGTSKTLTLSGGFLGTGASWEWYSDAALTVPSGSGITITVDPAITTTFFVRAEGGCNITDPEADW